MLRTSYLNIRVFNGLQKEDHLMKEIRRKEKSLEDKEEMIDILRKTKYVTIAMCQNNTPYLVTLSHGYDPEKNVIYFHCAFEGKKIDILKSNNIVWGSALLDKGYVSGKCDHLYATTHFRGTVTFIDNIEEKRHALIIMIQQLESDPKEVINKQISEKSLNRVNIGRIDIDYLSGKKSEDPIVLL
jgi:nitroimidazol reductase NimA-like FMN-containing flavoprotein (pyridoxamine 5'-phosphate oxidase superfamily)